MNTISIRLANGRTVQMKSEKSFSILSIDSVKRIFAGVSLGVTFMVCVALMRLAN